MIFLMVQLASLIDLFPLKSTSHYFPLKLLCTPYNYTTFSPFLPHIPQFFISSPSDLISRKPFLVLAFTTLHLLTSYFPSPCQPRCHASHVHPVLV